MSSCEEQIYSNDYVDFIISKDVLDVIDLPGECIQRIEDENDMYFYPRTYFEEFFFLWILMHQFRNVTVCQMRQRLKCPGF